MLVTYIRTVISTAGHVSCVCVLFGSNLLINVIDGTTRSIVKVISTVTMAKIEQDSRIPHSERVRTFQDSTDDDLIVNREGTGASDKGKTGPNQVMDEQETLKKTMAYAKEKYPEFNNGKDILGNESKLRELATALICNELGGDDPSLLSDDFQFLFPVVGPLTKTQFVEAFTKFKVREAFPTSAANFYNFKIDPLEPNRIWMMSRGAYEHLGTLNLGPAKYPATGKRICLPPQCFSMSFNAEGECYKLTGGYNVDRSAGIETGGLGGMFGIVYALGLTKLPFPEGRPWKRSLMWEAFTLRIPQIVDDWKAVLATTPVTESSKIVPEAAKSSKSKSQ